MDRETALEIHELHARLCKAIADPKRLLIINELRDGPLTVGELAAALGLGQPTAEAAPPAGVRL
ncbi:MAG: ArsR/SmtB family transcription factor, partial [Candidatus Nanopelagicales bacterium]